MSTSVDKLRPILPWIVVAFAVIVLAVTFRYSAVMCDGGPACVVLDRWTGNLLLEPIQMR